MDQESFRQLLQTQSASTSSASRGSLFTTNFKTSSKSKVIDPSQPAFKPRKVKKSTDSQYRDRAAERRVGEGNDYAQVEAVLEDFEKRTADSEDKNAVEEQRRYLGGDSEHSVLVKGLDVVLLQQNQARAALNTEDDDSLEQAFLEVSSQHTAPKKRTRGDLIRELKEKRALNGEISAEVKVSKTAEEEVQLLEEAKKKGKFKPIGFKPIGASADVEKKKAKVERNGERKNKRRKVVEEIKGSQVEEVKEEIPPPPVPTTPTPQPLIPAPVSLPEPEPIPDDFDIFADAGEYKGVDFGDDDEDDESDKSEMDQRVKPADEDDQPSTNAPRRWIETGEPEPLPEKPELLSSVLKSARIPDGGDEQEGEDGEVEQPTRLIPLESSALPSIKDFLAMDDAAGGAGKRRKRKDKKKRGDEGEDDSKRPTAEAKADRDYKRLKSYTDKKAGASK